MHAGDTSGVSERVTVPEAAERLGVSQRAIRARADRGTIGSDKDEEGRVWIHIPPETPPYTGGDTAGDTAGESALLRERAERIASLEAQLAAEREANRENRRIIAGLTQRIPELEATDSRGENHASDDESHEEHPQRAKSPEEVSTPTEETPEPQRGSQRPWWKRIFGG